MNDQVIKDMPESMNSIRRSLNFGKDLLAFCAYTCALVILCTILAISLLALSYHGDNCAGGGDVTTFKLPKATVQYYCEPMPPPNGDSNG